MSDGVWYNPMSWTAPWFVIWLGLYVVIWARAGGTYLLGRGIRTGVGRTHTRLARVLQTDGYQRAERAIDRWGAPVVALSFLTIGFQTLVNFAAGVTRMRWFRYVPALAVGGAAWAAIYATVGVVSFRALSYFFTRWPVATGVVVALIVIALVIWFVVKLRGRHNNV
ncbi:VTT domain-containing protein [Auritidibacter ignavus]|uniref:VTT domain-containing protein n=1 Tax=Auritidibacter ignavus TaxID=678932 RepID=A0AAJ6DBM4_9MICC|nr:VTT domain-containing protein [Auritidibacter ignavus]WGH81020.1 VTT domain-containing protein [Auritidibacter ignavus]WGH85621.1 VTT domain-containing protein [Auritidibacter ignavus]WGH87910.1 VTT domain-containing protein [Auritidibacter ignavus]WGH92564.1 VTT domain-containing protein [Auritidibacter ignavus]WHS29057.1 VTT domain-containing protein [Auritidibacter ignavus]